MGDELALALALPEAQLSSEDIVSLAREVIAREASRDVIRRNTNPKPPDVSQSGVQRPGVTVDFGHKRIVNLPDEVIDIIKDEIERLAISHNDLSGFPARLAECKRLRYLNARCNQFEEVPRPVLQLASLEILDLSRNKIRYVPKEIRNMTSLKVLSIMINNIERLPTSLGEMSRLRVLKLDDNPLVFPPRSVLVPDKGLVTSSVEEVLLHITEKVKKYLRQNANTQNGRHKFQPDSDSEIGDSAETPRPTRPFGTRFPVKPSLNGIDIAVAPSTSPEPAPPVPVKSHERMKSVQTQSRIPSLLSPPDLNTVSDRKNGDDVTIRPKRHGMVTPRGPEGAAQTLALSPSALQEAFSSVNSRSHSRTGSNASTASIASESIVETSKLIYNTANELSKKLNLMRPMLEWHNQVQLKAQIELDLRTASSRVDILGRYLRRAQQDSGQASSQRPSYLLRPVMDCLASISQFSRSLGQCASLFCRTSSHETYKTTFWEVQKGTWDIFVSNSKMSDAIRSANHSRQTSTSSQYKQTIYGDTIRPTISTSMFDIRQQPRNGLIPSPTGSSYSGAAHQSQNPSLYNAFSPIPTTVVNTATYTPAISGLGPDGSYMDVSRQDVDNDPLWDSIYQSLKILCERASEGLPRIQNHFFNERRKAIRAYDQDNEVVKQLGSLVARCNSLVDVVTRLIGKMENFKTTDRSIRQSMEFWQLIRTLTLEWAGYLEKSRSLSALPSGIHTEIKPVMKSIHVAVKDLSNRLVNSPWAHYLNQSNYPSFNENFPPRGPTPSIAPLQVPQSNISSVPSTPLSAALGPAAVATVPNKGSTGRPGMNVFERADKLASFMPRQQEMLYGKKMS